MREAERLSAARRASAFRPSTDSLGHWSLACSITVCPTASKGVGKYLGAAAATTLPRTSATQTPSTTGGSAQGRTAAGTQGKARAGAKTAGAGSSSSSSIDWADPALDAVARANATAAKGKGKAKSKGGGGGFGDFSGW